MEFLAVPGHREGELLFGDAYSQIATLGKRHTRYVMLVKRVDKDSYTVGAPLARHARTLPRQLYLSLTWDRGREMAGHKLPKGIDLSACSQDSLDAMARELNQRPRKTLGY